MKCSVTRPLVVLCAVLPAVLGMAPPALAGDTTKSSYKSSGGRAHVNWLEREPTSDELPLPGDVHVGFLKVNQQPGYLSAWGYVSDYECPDGVLPGGGGGHALEEEEPPSEPSGCEYLGDRWLSGDRNSLELTYGKGTASLRGTLTVGNGGHGEGGAVGQAPVDMTWTQEGTVHSFKRTENWSDGVYNYTSRVSGTNFQAALSGSMGPMRFDDNEDDQSSGFAEQWREQSRTRIG